MSTPADQRAADHGPAARRANRTPWGRTRCWWETWGNLITGVWLIVVSASVLGLALVVKSEADRTRDTAQASCVRTMTFGPELADAYERFDILSPRALVEYRRTIPKECP